MAQKVLLLTQDSELEQSIGKKLISFELYTGSSAEKFQWLLKKHLKCSLVFIDDRCFTGESQERYSHTVNLMRDLRSIRPQLDIVPITLPELRQDYLREKPLIVYTFL